MLATVILALVRKGDGCRFTEGENWSSLAGRAHHVAVATLPNVDGRSAD